MNRFLTAGAAMLALGHPGISQTTFATITGLVADPKGAAVSGATITVTNMETHYSYLARSNETGNGVSTTSARSCPHFVNQELRGSYDFFATDEFRPFRPLTLDIGLRYELHPPFTNNDGYKIPSSTGLAAQHRRSFDTRLGDCI